MCKNDIYIKSIGDKSTLLWSKYTLRQGGKFQFVLQVIMYTIGIIYSAFRICQRSLLNVDSVRSQIILLDPNCLNMLIAVAELLQIPGLYVPWYELFLMSTFRKKCSLHILRPLTWLVHMYCKAIF